MLQTRSGQYRPGACNIGAVEIARRRRFGLASLVAAAVLAAGLVALRAPNETRWLVAFPAAAAAIGLLQARLRFCVAFGLAGVRNFGRLGEREQVTERGARTADLRSSVTLLALGVGLALAVTAAFVALPG